MKMLLCYRYNIENIAFFTKGQFNMRHISTTSSNKKISDLNIPAKESMNDIKIIDQVTKVMNNYDIFN